MASNYPKPMFHPALPGQMTAATGPASERVLTSSGWTDQPDTDLTKLSREDLNRQASDAGVDQPERFPNKQAVVDALTD